MKNWSTDTSKFKTKKQQKIWELTQKINFGFDDTDSCDYQEIKHYWPEIIGSLQPENRRLWEFRLWHRLYSLPLNSNWWQPLPERII